MACHRCDARMYDSPGAPAATCLACGAESALDMERERRWIEARATFSEGRGLPAFRTGAHYNRMLDQDWQRASAAQLGVRFVA